MGWIEIVAWIIASLFLAALNLSTRARRMPQTSGIFLMAVLGGLLGGIIAHLVLVEPLFGGGFSFGAFVGAVVIAELSILVALGACKPRTGDGNA